MNTGAASFVEGVDQAFTFIFSISFFFIIGITALMIFILIHYKKKKNKKPSRSEGNLKLEIFWTSVTLILVILMFYVGYVGFKPMRDVPKNAMKVKAIGRKWEWEFVYQNGKRSKDLVVPKDRPVKLNLVSEDVNHSLYIPAFRVKEDVVPGYNNYMWFMPYYIGDYEILCAEYCGVGHSAMLAKTKVVSQEEFDEWYAKVEEDQEDPPGLQVIKDNACTACHTLDGTKRVAKSFKGLYGSKEIVITNGEEREVTVDGEYIRSSIYEPNKDIVKGYSKNVMQSYEGIISEEEVDDIIVYLKTIGEE